MAVQAKTIIQDAMRALNDKSGVRVSAADLVQCLNRAQRDIAVVRPDTTAAIVELSLVEGYKQRLPDTAASLIDIPCNATGTRRQIAKTDLRLLDSYSPSWRSGAKKQEIVHFSHDLRDPRVFYVYPPASNTAKVDLEASLYPIDIPAPASPGDTADTVTGDISLGDEWSTALLMVTLYYAYLTDVEALANVGLAAAYKQTAEQILGVQLQSAITASKPE